jgi:hypothetical protein
VHPLSTGASFLVIDSSSPTSSGNCSPHPRKPWRPRNLTPSCPSPLYFRFRERRCQSESQKSIFLTRGLLIATALLRLSVSGIARLSNQALMKLKVDHICETRLSHLSYPADVHHFLFRPPAESGLSGPWSKSG